MRMPGSLARSFLASMAYFWPVPESSEVILQMAAWASVKMMTVRFLVAITLVCPLAPTHVGFVGGTFLRVSSSTLQARAVCEHG